LPARSSTDLGRRTFVFGLASLPLYAKAPLQTFTADQAALIETLIDCIIPADTDPGAKEAGVLYYLDRQLAGPLNRFLPVYRDGLPLLQKLCPQALPELSLEARTSFLQGIEKSGPPEAQSFFRLLIEQTMQGFYGSPENGGNREEASWRMLHITEMFDGHAH
jgi:gluconate 2-dehydrogenase gamma chain